MVFIVAKEYDESTPRIGVVLEKSRGGYE